MISHPLVDDYIKMAERGEIVVNEERKLLFKIIKEKIYPRDDLYFDNDLIEKFIRFTEKNFFPLAKYQLFLTPFIFLFRKEDGEPHSLVGVVRMVSCLPGPRSLSVLSTLSEIMM